MDAAATPPERSPLDASGGLLPFSDQKGLCWYCQAVTADVRSTEELLDAMLNCPGPLHEGA
jgi:hypothetical protein